MDDTIEPRDVIRKSVEEDEKDELLDRAAKLHGHYCPGLALGVNAATEAVKRLRAETNGMEDVLAIVEINNCLSDGVQYVTGCTFGNNSLIFKDLGKTAFTLAKRNGRGIRFVTKKDAGEEWNDEFPKYEKLFENIVEKREGTEEDERKFSRLGKEVSHHIAELPAKDLFDIEKVDVDIPEYAPIHDSHICEKCGEKVMATRTVEKKGKILCLECSDSDHHELTSFGIKIRG